MVKHFPISKKLHVRIRPTAATMSWNKAPLGVEDAILGAVVGAEPYGDKFQVNLILRTWSWNLFLVRETVEIGVHFMLIRPCFMLTPYELAARQLLLAYSL